MKLAAFDVTGPRHLDLYPAALHEEGQTVTEYAVVLAVLLIASGGIVFGLQTHISSFIERVAAALAEILP
jgi:Flp pilus assembly pilin Flp